ncbi:MAG: hypothetical protein N2445_04205 [Acidobacteria bacterium]|nr:hypothetical protein [Acidobacteriota bacterium]
MIRKIFVLLALIIGMNVLGQGEAKIEVKGVKERFILGEPCYVKLKIANESDKGLPIGMDSLYDERSVFCLMIEGPRRRECDFMVRPVADRLPGCGKKIEGGKEEEWEVEIGILGLYSVGKFKIWVEYNPGRIKGENTIVNCNFYDKAIKSNVAEIEFIKPSGKDLEVFENNHNACNQITLKPEELLQKYPTSTYAGYVLAGNAYENLENYANLTSDEIIDDVLGVRWRPDRETYKEEVKKKYKEKLGLLEKFIKAHPDFAKADMIHSGIVRCLLILGKEKEAIEELKVLSKMEGKFAEGAKRALEKISKAECKTNSTEENKSKAKQSIKKE